MSLSANNKTQRGGYLTWILLRRSILSTKLENKAATQTITFNVKSLLLLTAQQQKSTLKLSRNRYLNAT